MYLPDDIFKIIIDKVYELNHRKYWKKLMKEYINAVYLRLLDKDWSIKDKYLDGKQLKGRFFFRGIVKGALLNDKYSIEFINYSSEDELTEHWIDDYLKTLKTL